MRVLGLSLLAAGLLVNVVGALRILVLARRVGVAWLLGCLMSFGFLLFVALYWQSTRRPFLVWLAGLLAVGGGAALIGEP